MKDYEKTIHKLNLEDDFLFIKVMTDAEICRKVLEQILHISIKKVTLPIVQKTIDLLCEGKGIRLDVYVNDDKGTVYNVEMQRGKKKELPKRARYYQGNIDLDLISKGEPYTTLRKTYVIFICTFDPFKNGRHVYTFENICRENPSLCLGDETIKLFLNTRGTLDDVSMDMKEFLTYIENTTDAFAAQAKNPLIKDIQKKVIQVKQNKEVEVEYMTLFQRDRENIERGREEGMAEGLRQGHERGLEQGLKQGREQGIEESLQILKLYLKGLSEQMIASALNLDISYVEQIISNFKKE